MFVHGKSLRLHQNQGAENNRMQEMTLLGKLMRSSNVHCRVGYGDPFMRDAGFGYYYPDPDEVSASLNTDWICVPAWQALGIQSFQ